MSKFKDLNGKKFGRLKVIEPAGRDSQSRYRWRCVCDCGVEKVVNGQDLSSEKTKSCGCLRNERIAKLSKSKLQNLVGKKFGRLTVLKNIGKNKHGEYQWKCLCECGNKTTVIGSNLKYGGKTKSCGCLIRESATKLLTTHGLSSHPLHGIYCGIRGRCFLKTNTSYKRYGARGISICKRWLDFQIFYDDNIEAYTKHVEKHGHKNTTIDRINNDGDYTPENCRWATWKEQGRNQRTNRLITYKGETKPLSEWAEQIGINDTGLSTRLKKWSLEDAMTRPIRSY